MAFYISVIHLWIHPFIYHIPSFHPTEYRIMHFEAKSCIGYPICSLMCILNSISWWKFFIHSYFFLSIQCDKWFCQQVWWNSEWWTWHFQREIKYVWNAFRIYLSQPLQNSSIKCHQLFMFIVKSMANVQPYRAFMRYLNQFTNSPIHRRTINNDFWFYFRHNDRSASGFYNKFSATFDFNISSVYRTDLWIPISRNIQKNIRACKYDSCIVCIQFKFRHEQRRASSQTIFENDGISAIDAKSDCHWNKLLSLFNFVCNGHILNQNRQTINFINWKSIHSLLLFINQTAEKKQLFDYSISWQNDG